jgi:putative redox protein
MTSTAPAARLVDMSLTARARRVGGRLRHEVSIGSHHVIVTDEPRRLGGDDTGPAPHELVPAALASCVATMIAMYAQTKGWELPDVTVDVEYDTDAVPRLVKVRLELPADLSPEQVKRLRRVAQTCPVRRALEAGFRFEEQVVVAADAERGHAA